MKKLLLFLSVLNVSFSFSQTSPWVKKISGTGTQQISSSVLCNQYAYHTGYFTGTVDMDPGTGTYNLTSAGDKDIFISKVDADGNLIWAVSIGNSGTNVPTYIQEGTLGTLYITGKTPYNGGNTIDIDPGTGTYAVSDKAFLLKIDTASNFISGMALRQSLAYVDDTGNVYTTGTFGGGVDFDPGPGTCNLVSRGGDDVFIMKTDSVGNFIWAKKVGGTGDESPTAITLDDSGNVVITGIFQNTADFDPGIDVHNLTSNASLFYVYNAFVLKLTNLGIYRWAKAFVCDNYSIADKVRTDAKGNVYVSGMFDGNADLAPGSGFTYTSISAEDAFVSKITATGNTVYGIPIGGVADEAITTLYAETGHIFVTGKFANTIDCDPSSSVYNLYPSSSYNIFIIKYDSIGGLVWAEQISNPHGGSTTISAVSSTLEVDNAGSMLMTGNFIGTFDFNPGSGTDTLVSTGSNENLFLLKLDNAGLLPVSLLRFDATPIGEDALLTWQTASESNASRFEIERSINGTSYTSVGTVKAVGNSSSLQQYTFTDSKILNTISTQLYYRLKQWDNDGSYRYSPVRVIAPRQVKPVMLVYPNPVTDYMRIELQAQSYDQELNYQVTTIQGIIVQQGTVNRQNLSGIDMRQLSTGIYFIQAGDYLPVKLVKE